jgi:5,10-methylenetetrahydromethanopterin reductase
MAPAAKTSVRFYVALQGDKRPGAYGPLAKYIEKLGFDRVYVYDDLMYRPAWPILTLMAGHTERIELGPCLVNGFYRHPAIIAENAVFLDELSGGRAVLGVGRGAFFDFLNMDHSESVTRTGCEETIQLVKRFFSGSGDNFKGKHFQANEKAVLRWRPPRGDIPVILGSWNEKMAVVAGRYCAEMQTAECWETGYIETLYGQLKKGAQKAKRKDIPYFSIGGICCISPDEAAAVQRAKHTLAVYLPYLSSILARSGIDAKKENLKQIEALSKKGDFEAVIPLISEKLVRLLSLSGTPDQVVKKLTVLKDLSNIHAIMFSPPYGTADTIEENLEFIADTVITKIM